MADNDKPNTPGGPDFMARLRENINERAPERATVPDGMHKPVSPLPMPDPPEEVRKYAPLSVRREHKNKTRNQTIAEFIIALPYREAMAMGQGIYAKLKVGSVGSEPVFPSAEELTAAIQDWAWTWETFEDEERPGSKE
jgi:hypothetical protein